jgi:hypothetical protein
MKDMYNKVLNSNLRDNVLKMYFLSADLTGQSYDMGRMMAFAAGWLENQSIWMHMSYKVGATRIFKFPNLKLHS